MGLTKVEWADCSFNPWWGCEKVSPACAHCYADTLSKRYAAGKQLWGAGHEFRFFGDKHWAEPLKWARLLPAKLGRRPRVFCASMADVFEERDELVEPRERLLHLIIHTPELDWLLLTKRPEVMRDRYYAGGWTLTENLWLGTSIENARYTWRADALREIPAAVRFISAEPLLGSLLPESFECPRCEGQRYDVGSCALCANRGRLDDRGGRERMPLDLTGIDWVIAGGESGPKARPSHPDWFRELRDACLARYAPCANCESWPTPGDARGGTCRVCGTYEPVIGRLGHMPGRPAFFFKQWGEWLPYEEDAQPPFWSPATGGRMIDGHVLPVGLSDHAPVRADGDTWWWPEIDDPTIYRRLGKRTNGRLLDGREWDEFPAGAGVPA